MPEIVISGLKKHFEDVRAVDGISVRIEDGEMFVVMGPTGCGKTTFLKLIAGLLDPDEGKIFFGGDLVNDLGPRERKVRMVFEDYALFPHLKVYEPQGYSNLSFPLKVNKITTDKIKGVVRGIVDRLGISKLLFDRKPSEISAGQKQQVALGRALTLTPNVLLLDEPLRNLDPHTKLDSRREVEDIHQELGATTIYVTHDLAEAFAIADRVGIMTEGRFIQVGTPKEILNDPINDQVSDFTESYQATIRDAFES